MAIEETVLGVTLGLGLLLVLLRYAGVLHMIQKAAGFIVAGLMFYVIEIAWTTGSLATRVSATVSSWLGFAFEIIAFILIIIGAIWAAVELIRK